MRGTWKTGGAILGLLLSAVPAAGQLNDSCTVSALNRTTPVLPDGTWVLPNVPANQGPVRVRATCVENGLTRSGQSDFFVVPPRGVIEVAEILFDSPEPIPLRLALSAPATILDAIGRTVQLTATATFSDGSTVDLTAGSAGTSYRSSNPAIAAVDDAGLVTAHASGRVLVSALNEGSLAVFELQVIGSGDSDGDGLPDDFELANGLDPNNPFDVIDDPDGDGLGTLAEFQAGLDPFNPDTDGDRLLDGEEGAFGTDPLLFDTDGDRVSDGLEVQAGSDPRDPASANLAAILESLTVRPSALTIVYNTIAGEASRRLEVTARLIDGTEIDARSRRYGTSYASSDLTIASFGAEDGRVFAGRNGTAVVSVRLGSAVATTSVTVETFSPAALATIPIPGFANGVAVDQRHAYIAAGAAGLVVVEVIDPGAPRIAGIVDTPGNANDVRVSGDFAYVADGSRGLQIVDVSDPAQPRIAGTVDTPGDATDLVVRGDLVFLADGPAGLQVIDAADRSAPVLIGGVDTPGRARGIDAVEEWVVLADELAGVHVISVADPARPAIVGSTHTRTSSASRAADVVIEGRLAFVTDGAAYQLGGLRVIDFQVPGTPVVVGSTSNAFGLISVAAEAGFVLASDYYYLNAVPIFGASVPPGFQGLLDFAPSSRRGDSGTGIAVRDGLVFLTGNLASFNLDNGVSLDSALHIGRYRKLEDDLGVAPEVAITQPGEGASARERTALTLQAEVSDDVGVAAVEFLADGAVLSRDALYPYEGKVTVPVGVPDFRIGARAIDFGGNEGLAEAVVEVIPDDRPAVGLLAPGSAVRLVEGTTLAVAADASDDVRVASVELRVNGTSRLVVTAAPYRFEVPIALGATQVTVEAVARDDAGQSASTGVLTFAVEDDPPPVVTLLDPNELIEVARGEILPVSVAATDDVGVASVRLLFNGQPGLTDTEAPYEFEVTVPANASDIRLSALATDTLGQTATAQEIVLRVTEGAATTAAGRVVDTGGQPLAAAAVTCLGVAGSTGPDGSFSIPGVPALLGDVRCTASLALPQGAVLSGQSAAAPPVAGGTTQVGSIVLSPLTPYPFAAPGFTAVEGNPTEPLWVAVGDLNLDGLSDLVAASNRTWEVSVWMAQADGTWLARPRIRVGTRPAGVALADFDSDGFLDLVTANSGSNDVSVLLGRGDGTFLAPQAFAAGASPSGVAVSDLNRDGVADVVTANRGSNDLSVLPGRLDGTLGTGTRLPAGAAPSAVAVGDLNQDALLDIVATNETSNSVTVHLGRGDGTFGSEPAVPVGTRPRGIRIQDLDADGKPEVIAANQSDLSILVRGGGGFLEEVRVAAFTDGAFAFADLDRNGYPDLISNSVRLGTGDFEFEAPVGLGIGATSFAIADLNRDGMTDVLAGRPSSAVLLFGRGNGSLQVPNRISAGVTLRSVAAADVNGDGRPDLVTANEMSDAAGIRLGNGDGSFLPLQLFPVCDAPVSASTGDVDGDALLDLAATCSASSDLAVLLGAGDGAFGSRSIYDAIFQETSEVLADLDGDGALDVATAGSDFITVFRNRGDGTFEPGQRLTLSLTSNRLNDIAAGDVDGNGAADLAAAASGSGRSHVSLFRSRGDGTFHPEVRLTVGSRPASLALADLNGDGALDLVTANRGTFDLSLRLGQGNGSFLAARSYPLVFGIQPESVAVGDVTGDGVPDLVATALDDMWVLAGQGDGTFGPPQRFAGGGTSLVLVDLDGNGTLEAVTVRGGSVGVVLHL